MPEEMSPERKMESCNQSRLPICNSKRRGSIVLNAHPINLGPISHNTTEIVKQQREEGKYIFNTRKNFYNYFKEPLRAHGQKFIQLTNVPHDFYKAREHVRHYKSYKHKYNKGELQRLSEGGLNLSCLCYERWRLSNQVLPLSPSEASSSLEIASTRACSCSCILWRHGLMRKSVNIKLHITKDKQAITFSTFFAFSISVGSGWLAPKTFSTCYINILKYQEQKLATSNFKSVKVIRIPP